MPGCCFPGCYNRGGGKDYSIRFFRIPTAKSNQERRQAWITFINRLDVPERAVLCEAHFEDDQFELNRLDNRKLLKWNAIPTLRTAIPLKSQGVKRKLSDEGDPLAEINDISEQQNLDQLKHLQDELNNTKTTVATLEHQLNDLEKQFTCIFTEDQIHIMKYGNHRAKEWSDKTIQRAFKLYMACGTKGYEELRRQNFPLPSVRTLQYRIENLNQVHWKMQSTKVEGTWEL